ncbi:MAG: aminotransferase class I/II-fold pyridoxal phosphate-dependent enzyme [Pyrinomonadaceae bacterium]
MKQLGDMPADEFETAGKNLIDWISGYFSRIDELPVLADVEPGWLKSSLPEGPPSSGEDFARIAEDLENLILPAVTHWNHPNFHGLFSTSTSSPGILGELVAAAFDQKAMLWRTSPASTELEEVTVDWLAKILGLPDGLFGLIYDTASVSTMHAIAAARERLDLDIREKGMSGRDDLPLLRVYCSEQTHSSIEKGLITLGLGKRSMCSVAVDDAFSVDCEALEASIANDLENGYRPFAIVATVGTTSTASVDNIKRIGEIAEKYGLWLHVDMAYAGSAMALPELRHHIEGIEKADSIVVNPHKWFFTPFDLSVLFIKDREILKQAFSLVPEYLRVTEEVTNQMDFGIQLGRRFRALKLWFVIRYFGVEGIRDRIREHVRLAGLFAANVEKSDRFELAAPFNFALVCFRAKSEGFDNDQLNEELMKRINESGKAYISHTKLNGRIALRLSVGSIRVEERHIEEIWSLVNTTFEDICGR